MKNITETINKIKEFYTKSEFEKGLNIAEENQLVIAYKKGGAFNLLVNPNFKLSINTPESLSYCLDSLSLNDLIFQEVGNFELSSESFETTEKITFAICEVENMVYHSLSE